MISFRLVVCLGISTILQPVLARQWNDTGKGTIIFEEAWIIPALIGSVAQNVPPVGQTIADLEANLLDIHNQRLADMDANGVDYVNKHLGEELTILLKNNGVNRTRQGISDQAAAEDMAQNVNDQLAAAIANNTVRFGGFASLAMHNATTAAQELKRTVVELGFLGALINDYQESGPDNATLLFYDQPEYDVFWEMVTELDVPVYLHPRTNIPQIQTPLYGHAPWLKGPTQEFADTLSTHVMGLCTNGVFDRFPNLTVIVGHLGERIPSDLWRIDDQLSRQVPIGMPMLRNLSSYWKTNLIETVSGNFATDLFNFHAKEIGLNRIMWIILTCLWTKTSTNFWEKAMDKTKAKLASTKLAAFFDTHDDDDSSFPQKTVDDAKLSQYLTAGTVRKSRREKEQEAAEAKKREEEADAAKAYAEFLDTFDTDHSARKSTSNFVKADSKSAYVPASKDFSEGSSRLTSGKARSPSPVGPPKPKGKRAMDAFLEEIKRDQAEREANFWAWSICDGTSSVRRSKRKQGSGDPQTSNVFVANLPPHVTEQSLGVFFARCGPVGSVKIMWPRTDNSVGPGADMTNSRRTKSSGLSGFVSFMKRKDAEQALRELDGFDWGGSILRVGWSKAVPIAQKPMYTSGLAKNSDAGHQRSRSRSRSPARERHHGRSSRRSPSPWSRSRSASPRRRSRSRSRRRDDSRSASPRRSHIRDEEEEFVTDTFIRAVAAEIKGHGSKYEQNLRERERSNPKFAFMLKKDHRRHAFYRGLIESDRPLGPEFDDDGYNSVYSSDSAEDSERERVRKNVLGKLARKRFEAMLRALSGKRGEMARCMAFSLEHAEAAHEVAEIIVASLLVDGTPVPRKVARLHLICDILHNSAASVPSAWKFRQEFQARLGVVFDHLANIYHSFPGRITAETFKKQITAVVDIWEDWIVFPPDFTTELRTRLEGMTAEDEHKSQETVEPVKSDPAAAPSRFKTSFKTSTFQPAVEPTSSDAADLDGEPIPMEGVDGEDVDLDGEEIDDVDGEPLDGEVLDQDDLDGVPLDDGEPITAPMDEDSDLDGAPMETE
ncbi:hypothetical protein MVEN_00515100 [Mycena venus]|uniref:U2 snRNP-associated SURP motif-containing protein n=1 Tax=Mycena venus TaxID=2733690 RepID=A0A8H6YNQ9_9AGAR|nr:hypothetical protein MVEN_00515100 [Mycena venus]